MARLLDFWDRALIEPFEWGVNDCALWTASYVEAVTGVDPAEAYRGTYRNKWGACRLLAVSGGLLGICKDQMKDFPDGESMNGVAVIQNNNEFAAAVLVDGVAWLKCETGLASVFDPEIKIGWKICRKQ